jgi:hypothetical protein
MRFQVEALMAHYADPKAFHLALNNLFDLYANRALRFGDHTGIRPMIPTYHLPAPLLRQLEADLERMVTENPGAALALVDDLWQDDYYEVKLTAIIVLGLIPLDDPQPVLDRLNQWIDKRLDLSLLPKLFSVGTRQLQIKFPQSWENYLKTFLESEDPQKVSVGFLGLAEGLNTRQNQNIPALFRLIGPYVRDPQPQNSKELATLLMALAEASPTETGFFLKQILSVTDSPEIKQLVRASLPGFPAEIQDELRPMVIRPRQN